MVELTAEQKLVKLGLRSPNQTSNAAEEIIQIQQNNIAEDWDTYSTNFENENMSSWSDYETWQTNNGVGSDMATSIRNTLESKYSSFSDHEVDVTDTWGSWDDYRNAFAWGSASRSERVNTDGLPASVFRHYSEAGVGRDGQEIPAGGIEIAAAEIHLSQTSNLQDTPRQSANGDAITYSNQSLATTNTVVDTPVTVEADVTNNALFDIAVTVELIVDGEVDDTKEVVVSANSTQTVSFDWVPVVTGDFDVRIGPLSTTTVNVVHANI